MRCYKDSVERFRSIVASYSSYGRVNYKLACLLKKMGFCKESSMYYFDGNPFGEPVPHHYKNGESNVRIAAPLFDEICSFIMEKTGLMFDIELPTKQYIIGYTIPSEEFFYAISIDKYPPVTCKEAVQRAFIKICEMYLKCKKIKLE